MERKCGDTVNCKAGRATRSTIESRINLNFAADCMAALFIVYMTFSYLSSKLYHFVFYFARDV